MTEMPREIEDGEYVLATKFHDGDASDPWAVGFYAGSDKDRHFVKDANGKQIRINGFRRVKKVSDELGSWLYNNRIELERMASQTSPDIFNLWMIADSADLAEKPNSCIECELIGKAACPDHGVNDAEVREAIALLNKWPKVEFFKGRTVLQRAIETLIRVAQSQNKNGDTK